MKKNIAIIILLVIILILGGYLVFDKVTNKEETKKDIIKNENIKTENTESSLLVTDLVNGKVIQTYSHFDGSEFKLFEDEIPYVEVALPYLNIDSEAAKEINNKIQTKFNDQINIIKNNITEQVSNKGPYRTVINYSYTVRNNVLFILIEKFTHAYRAGGGSSTVSYYYDLENDKILNTAEALQKVGKTIDELRERLDNVEYYNIERKEEILNDLDNNVSLFVIGNRILINANSDWSFNDFELTLY